MRTLGIDDDLINSIDWLYRQTKFHVNGKKIPIGSGVIQGGVLSPSLFIIMFNDLIETLSSRGFDVFAYADDLAVIVNSKEELDLLIDMAEEWTILNKMKINKKKSAVMRLQKSRGARL